MIKLLKQYVGMIILILTIWAICQHTGINVVYCSYNDKLVLRFDNLMLVDISVFRINFNNLYILVKECGQCVFMSIQEVNLYVVDCHYKPTD